MEEDANYECCIGEMNTVVLSKPGRSNSDIFDRLIDKVTDHCDDGQRYAESRKVRGLGARLMGEHPKAATLRGEQYEGDHTMGVARTRIHDF